MSDAFDDPFKGMNLDNFKKNNGIQKNTKEVGEVIHISEKDKEIVDKVALENNFTSREPSKKIKSKTRPCTFSLREEEEDIIYNYINISYNKHRRSKITGSDVVRAGLYMLLKYGDEEVLEMMLEKRGRG